MVRHHRAGSVYEEYLIVRVCVIVYGVRMLDSPVPAFAHRKTLKLLDTHTHTPIVESPKQEDSEMAGQPQDTQARIHAHPQVFQLCPPLHPSGVYPVHFPTYLTPPSSEPSCRVSRVISTWHCTATTNATAINATHTHTQTRMISSD